MKSVTIGQFKQELPELLKKVSEGESIILEKGRSHKKVAVISPYSEHISKPRKLGVFARRGTPKFKNWEMGESEFLGS